MSGQGKQAKVLTDAQVRAALGHVESVSRYPDRDRVMILLSVKAGLRAKEIASLTWSMVTDAQGELGDAIHLPNSASKGKNGGRTVPLNPALHQALADLRAKRGDAAVPQSRIIYSERGDGYSAAAVQVWFARLYRTLGFDGASSHSGRRTFITKAAKRIVEAGGSLRDIQELAGHSSLATTQRYIQGDSRAKQNVVRMI
jgi:integrase/recombinase XerD